MEEILKILNLSFIKTFFDKILPTKYYKKNLADSLARNIRLANTIQN